MYGIPDDRLHLDTESNFVSLQCCLVRFFRRLIGLQATRIVVSTSNWNMFIDRESPLECMLERSLAIGDWLNCDEWNARLNWALNGNARVRQSRQMSEINCITLWTRWCLFDLQNVKSFCVESVRSLLSPITFGVIRLRSPSIERQKSESNNYDLFVIGE